MKKTIRLTEKDLTRIINRVINEQNQSGTTPEIELQYLYDADLMNKFLTSDDVMEIYESFVRLMDSRKNRNWNSNLMGRYRPFEDYFAMNPAVFPELDQRLKNLFNTIKKDSGMEPKTQSRYLNRLHRIGSADLGKRHKNGLRKSKEFKGKVERLQACRRIDDSTIQSINNNKVMVFKAFDDKVLMYKGGQPICVMR